MPPRSLPCSLHGAPHHHHRRHRVRHLNHPHRRRLRRRLHHPFATATIATAAIATAAFTPLALMPPPLPPPPPPPPLPLMTAEEGLEARLRGQEQELESEESDDEGQPWP